MSDVQVHQSMLSAEGTLPLNATPIFTNKYVLYFLLLLLF